MLAIPSFNNNTITTNQTLFQCCIFFEEPEKGLAICMLVSELKWILVKRDKITLNKNLLPYVSLKLLSMKKEQV
jgi:hypothetical protein